MWGYTKSSLYNMGTHLGVGVRYVDASIPIYIYIYIYIGEIMCKGTHNLSYILWECVTN